MNLASKNRWILAGLVVASVLYSLLFLNRWLVTNVPIEVFARLWQYYVGYQDVGFARRLLLGTVLSGTRLTNLFENEFIFGHFFHSLTIIVLAGVCLIYILKKKAFNNPWKYLIIFFSPAFIQQMGSTTGNTDAVLILFFAVSALFVRSIWMTVVLSIPALLIHELYILLVPSLFVIHSVRQDKNFISLQYILPLGFIGLTFLMITSLGKIQVDKETYEQIVASKIPLAAYRHSLWSGYFELSTTIQQNFREGITFIKNYFPHYRFALLPTTYMLFIAASAAFQKGIKLPKQQILLFLTFILPISATFFAIDYYRWVGFSANIAIVFSLYLMGTGQFHLKKWQWAVLIISCLMAPFGGNEFLLPFPLHQPLLHKFGLF